MRRLLLLACAIVFVDTTFFAAMTPLLPHFEDQYDLTKTGAGVLAAAYPAGTFLGALPFGYLAAKWGVRAVALFGLLLMSLSSFAFAFADSIVMLDVARFVQGLAGAASWAGAMAWVASAAPRDRRGEMIGTTMGAAIAGALAGPALGALAEGVGIEPTFSAIGILGFALAAVALTMEPAAAEGTSTPRELLSALRDSRISGGMWLIAVPGLIFGTIGVLAPLRLDDLGVGATMIGAAWLCASLFEVGVSPLVGRISDRRGRLYPCMIGLAAGTVVMLLFPWPDKSWALIALVIFASPLIGTLWAPSMAMLSDGAEALGIAQGLAFALSNLGWSIGHTAGSAASARLADATSDTVPYLLLSGLCAASFLVLARARRTSPVPI
jgi:predicted MFS family arabinose efflux permease